MDSESNKAEDQNGGIEFRVDPEELKKATEILDQQPWMDRNLAYGKREYLFNKFFKGVKAHKRGGRIVLP